MEREREIIQPIQKWKHLYEKCWEGACMSREEDWWENPTLKTEPIAKAICKYCKVKEECLELGKKIGGYGIYGGKILGRSISHW